MAELVALNANASIAKIYTLFSMNRRNSYSKVANARNQNVGRITVSVFSEGLVVLTNAVV